ncbi:MAG: type I methionyl aminopeptidase [Muribaculaceae bacterium]|nr:type I methionyl aminopeptidase [Muribaculaceae bacterium]MBR1726707.1 type I methionyl aminopeptidase [Muribaculaceae bacterium]
MIILKTDEEIELLREANLVVARTLGEVARWVAPGITTRRLNQIADEYIRSQGCVPGFLGLYGFPGSVCISVNENVVHGIPSNYALREGDIVSVDCGAVTPAGFNGDSTYTFCVGEVSEEVKQLLRTTKEALYEGIAKAVPGNRIGDIGHAIQDYCEKRGYGVVREFVGHGVGKKLHEDPEVPNYGRRGTGPLIKNGMTIAIEPMINLGSKNIFQEADGWTCRTRDRKPSAHFEHSIAVHHGKPDILSSFDYVQQVLGDRFI